MNEFGAKKLGEVLAFSIAGIEIFERAESALSPLFAEFYAETLQSFIEQKEMVEGLAKELETEEITLKKAEGTKGKLIGMAEAYIGDAWDDPAECMEWLGFFEGAAIVHWKLVEGVAEEIQSDTLRDIADRGINLHKDVLSLVEDKIKEYGAKKSA